MTARASTVTLHEGVRERLVAMRDKAGESLICIPTTATPAKLTVAQAMRSSGQHDVASIARARGVSRASVCRALPRTPGPESTDQLSTP